MDAAPVLLRETRNARKQEKTEAQPHHHHPTLYKFFLFVLCKVNSCHCMQRVITDLRNFNQLRRARLPRMKGRGPQQRFCRSVSYRSDMQRRMARQAANHRNSSADRILSTLVELIASRPFIHFSGYASDKGVTLKYPRSPIEEVGTIKQRVQRVAEWN
jgi:hypothetical protein